MRRATPVYESEAADPEETSYLRLREAIRTGELMPNERLVEAGLAASLGVGRASIRTAIARLAQERLVVRVPNRGARVRRVTDQEAIEVLEVRLALECLVVRRVALKATDDDIWKLKAIIVEMEERLHADDAFGYADCNARFHRELLRIAQNETAARLWEGLFSHRFQLQHLTISTRPLERLAEHRRIVAAVEQHDADAAESSMRGHLGGVLARRLNEPEA